MCQLHDTLLQTGNAGESACGDALFRSPDDAAPSGIVTVSLY